MPCTTACLARLHVLHDCLPRTIACLAGLHALHDCHVLHDCLPRTIAHLRLLLLASHYCMPCTTACLARLHALHACTPFTTARPARLHALHDCTPCTTVPACLALLLASHCRPCPSAARPARPAVSLVPQQYFRVDKMASRDGLEMVLLLMRIELCVFEFVKHSALQKWFHLLNTSKESRPHLAAVGSSGSYSY